MSQHFLIFFSAAVVTNFVSYWFSDKIVLRMYHAQEVGAGFTPVSQGGCGEARELPRFTIPTDSSPPRPSRARPP